MEIHSTANHFVQVLLAEDNLTYRTLASALLTKWGCTITAVGDGRAAVEACSSQAFDFILMDMEMPEMDGLSATRLIREKEKASGRRTCIIATTANDSKGDQERCLQAGMDGCLSKSASAKELFEGIQRVAGTQLKTANLSISAVALSAVDQRAASPAQENSGVEIEVAEAFLEEGPQLLERIQNALLRRAASDLVDAAHALKGAAAQVRGSAVVQLTHSLETSGRAGDLQQAPHIFEQLSQEMDRLILALKSLPR